MSENQGKGAFDALLEDIGAADAATEELAKALKPEDGEGGSDTEDDDAAIAAAAAEGQGEGKKEGEEEEGEPMGKSFKVTLSDGTQVDALDGAELFKSLAARVEKGEASTAAALSAAVGLINKQGDLIKSLIEKVGQIGGQGKGRKAVLTVVEKPAAAAEALVKSQQPEGLQPEEFMAKALNCQAAGKLSGRQVAEAEAYLNMGQQPPPAIVQVVLG